MKTERQSMPRLPLAALLAGVAFIAGTIACSQPNGSSARSVCSQEQNGSMRATSTHVVCNDKVEATQASATRMSFFERLAAQNQSKQSAP